MAKPYDPEAFHLELETSYNLVAAEVDSWLSPAPAGAAAPVQSLVPVVGRSSRLGLGAAPSALSQASSKEDAKLRQQLGQTAVANGGKYGSKVVPAKAAASKDDEESDEEESRTRMVSKKADFTADPLARAKAKPVPQVTPAVALSIAVAPPTSPPASSTAASNEVKPTLGPALSIEVTKRPSESVSDASRSPRSPTFGEKALQLRLQNHPHLPLPRSLSLSPSSRARKRRRTASAGTASKSTSPSRSMSVDTLASMLEEPEPVQVQKVEGSSTTT